MLFVVPFENIFLLEISEDHHGFVEHNFDFLIAQLDQVRCHSSTEPVLRCSTYIFSAFLQLVVNQRSPEYLSLFIDDKLKKGGKDVSRAAQYGLRGTVTSNLI